MADAAASAFEGLPSQYGAARAGFRCAAVAGDGHDHADPAARPPPGRQPAAAGVLLMLAIMAGAVIGMILHQPSAGVVAGIALGAAVAVAYWLWDRRRAGR